MSSLFQSVGCIELYVSDLHDGIRYYRDFLGFKLLWRTDTSAGLGMQDGVTEVMLQTERKLMSVDFRVKSVPEALKRIKFSGGTVVRGPFDIPTGKCAVVSDSWGNIYAITDASKGSYVTDENCVVLGVGGRQ